MFVLLVSLSASLIVALVVYLHQRNLDPPPPNPPPDATERERDAAAMAFLAWCHRNDMGPLSKRNLPSKGRLYSDLNSEKR